MNSKTDKFTLFVYCNLFVLLSTNVCSQNINKLIVNMADENLTDYSFLVSYIEFVTEFTCLFGHPVVSRINAAKYYGNLSF